MKMNSISRLRTWVAGIVINVYKKIMLKKIYVNVCQVVVIVKHMQKRIPENVVGLLTIFMEKKNVVRYLEKLYGLMDTVVVWREKRNLKHAVRV